MYPCKKCGGTERYVSGRCKTCRKAAAKDYRIANPEKVKARKAKYASENFEKVRAAAHKNYEANKERAATNAKEWCKAHPERRKEIAKNWADRNKERCAATALAYRLRNQERVKAAKKAWYESHREAYRMYVRNRRALTSGANGKLSPDIAEKLFALQKGLCTCCGQSLGKSYHVDHIVALSKGGANTDDNVQLLRASCNVQKHAKDFGEFMRSRRLWLTSPP